MKKIIYLGGMPRAMTTLMANVLAEDYNAWEDWFATPGVTYAYTVFAKNASGTTASSSNPQNATVPG